MQYPAPQVALFAAAEAGDVERLRSLAAAGAMLDAWNDERETALYLAARNGHRSAVAALLDAGAEIDRPGHGDGCGTPLLGALFERQWGTAALLVRRGADLELDCRGQRVLGWRLTGLARDGATAPLRSLLEAGVPPDTPARGGYTALMGAVETRRPETVAALLRAGADASARADDGRTPLGIARAAGSQELVELLEAER